MNPFAESTALYRIDYPSRSILAMAVSEEFVQLAPLHARYGANLLRKCNPEYSAKLENVPRLSDTQVVLASKLEHELDHLQRSAMTSYGYLLNAIFADRVNSWFSAIREIPDREVRFPIHFKETASGTRHLNSFNAERLLQCDALALESFVDINIAEVQEYLAKLGGLPGLADSNNSARIPFADTRAGRVVIGGQAVLELFAVTRERSLLSFALGPDSLSREYEGSHIHNLAYYLWKTTFGLPLIESGGESDAWRSVGIPRGLRFPLELYAAADLALWPPFSSEGWIGNPGWSDIHPGWRFVRILELLQNRSPSQFTALSSPANISNAHFVALQDEWADALGWCRPGVLCNLWRKALEEFSQRESHTPTLWSIGEDSGRARSDYEYMRTRHLHPAAATLSYPDSLGLSRLWFQTVAVAQARSEQTMGPLEIFELDGAVNGSSRRPYHFAPAFSLSHGLQALTSGFQVPEGVPSNTAKLLAATQRMLPQDIMLYGKQVFDLPFQFGGYASNTQSGT